MHRIHINSAGSSGGALIFLKRMKYTELDESDLEIARTSLNEKENERKNKIKINKNKIDELGRKCKESERIHQVCHQRLDDAFLVIKFTYSLITGISISYQRENEC